MNPGGDWSFLVVGYLATVALELPVLVVCLSRRHSLLHRMWLGVWLTACTYPVVILTLPALFDEQSGFLRYLLTAEVFAIVGEVLIFRMASGTRLWQRPGRDDLAITLANLISLGIGLGGLSGSLRQVADRVFS